MKVIIDSSNRERNSWADLVQVEEGDSGFKFLNGSQFHFEHRKPGQYLIRTQFNKASAPVVFHDINSIVAEKLLLLSIDDAYEVMDNLAYEGENTDLSQVLSLQEAAEKWGLDDSTLRKAIANGRFEDHEFRKTKKNYIIKKAAMERLYGVPR